MWRSKVRFDEIMNDSDMFEKYVISQLNEGVQLSEVYASDLQSEFPKKSYSDCAQWLNVYKEKFGLKVTPPQSDWFKLFSEDIANAVNDMWPRISEQLAIDIRNTNKLNVGKVAELKAEKIDAVDTLKLAQEKVNLLNSEITSLKELLVNNKESHKAELSNLSAVISGLEQSHSSALNAHEKAYTNTDALLKDKTAEMSVLKTNFSNLETEHRSALNEGITLQTKCSLLTTKVGEYEEQIELLKEKLTEYESKNNEPGSDSKKLKSLTVKYEAKKAAIKELKTRIVSYDQRNEILINQNAKQGEQITKSTERLISASEAQQKVELELSLLRNELKMLKDNMS